MALPKTTLPPSLGVPPTPTALDASESRKQNVTYGNLFGGTRKYSKLNRLLRAESTSQTMGKPFVQSEDRYSNIPSDYSFVGAKPSETGRFSNLPESVGFGQYTSQPGSQDLYKSERNFEPMDNSYLRGGLSKRFFQIDHIIPLWAGGTDNLENKHLISNREHEDKTKVGAIARTLYYSEKIGLNEARSMSMNWRDKKVSDIRLDNGQIVGDSLKIAEDKVEEWKQPKRVGFKDWLKETPDTIDKLFSLEGRPSYAGSFIRNTITGLTGGWVNMDRKDVPEYGPHVAEWEKKLETGAEFGGQLTGTLASFVYLKGVLGKASAATGLSNVFKGSSLATKLAAQAPKISGGKITLSSHKAARVLESMGLFGIHGQLSRQEENTLKERSGRLMKDLAMGTLIGTAGQTIKSYAKLGAGTYSLSYLEGADPKDSLINAITVMGLHGLGYPAARKGVGFTKENIDRMATNAAMKQRQAILNPDKKVSYTLPEKKTIPTFEQIQKENIEIAKKLQDKVYNGEMSFQEAQVEMGKTVISSRQLYKGGLGKEARLHEELKDMFSISKKMKDSKTVDSTEMPGTPPALSEYFNKNKDLYDPKIKSTVRPIEMSEYKGNMPTGKMQLTGVSKNIDPTTSKNLRTVAELIKLRKVDDKVFFARREDMESFMNGLNSKVTKAEEAAGTARKYLNPEKNVEAWKIVDGQLMNLGYVPAEYRIEGSPRSINNRVRELSKKLGQDFELYDKNLNKNTVFDAMKQNDVKVLEGKIRLSSPEAIESGQPYLISEINKDLWLSSASRNKGIKDVGQAQAEKTLNIIREQQKSSGSPSEQVKKLPLGEGDNTWITGIKNDVSKMFAELENAKTSKEYKNIISKHFGKDAIPTKDIDKLFIGKETSTFDDISRLLKSSESRNSIMAQNIKNIMTVNDGYRFMWDGISSTPLRSAVKITSKTTEVKTKKVAKPEVIKKWENLTPAEEAGTVSVVPKKTTQTTIPLPAKVLKAMTKISAGKQTTEQLKPWQKYKTLNTPTKNFEYGSLAKEGRLRLEDITPKDWEGMKEVKVKMDREINSIVNQSKYLNNTEKGQLKDTLTAYGDILLDQVMFPGSVSKAKAKQAEYPTTKKEYVNFQPDVNQTNLIRSLMGKKPISKASLDQNSLSIQLSRLVKNSEGNQKTFYDNVVKELDRVTKKKWRAKEHEAKLSPMVKSFVGEDPSYKLSEFENIYETMGISLKQPALAKISSDVPVTSAVTGKSRGLMEGQPKELLEIANNVRLGQFDKLPKEIKDYISKNYKKDQIPEDVYPGGRLFNVIKNYTWKKLKETIPGATSESKDVTLTPKELSTKLAVKGSTVEPEDLAKVPYSELQWVLAPVEEAGGLSQMTVPQVSAVAKNLARTMSRYIK